jgi:predicted acylesterase/phospholipase RssA
MTDLKPFRALSIDGGGMRGTYTAAYLQEVADGFAKRRNVVRPLDIGAAFDLIVGTSTGAIIALALAVGTPLSTVLDLYRNHGSAVFPSRLPQTLAGVLRQAPTRKRQLRSGATALRTALTDAFGSMTLGDLYARRQIAVCVPAVDMGQQRAWVFKTAHLPTSKKRDDGYSLVDICMASSAAPLFRSLAAVETPGGSGAYHVFADGGLWANNPVLVALVDALAMTLPGRPIEVFALGTCPRPEGEVIPRDATDWSLSEWKFGGRAAQVSIAAQEFAFDQMARMLAQYVGRPCAIVRFPSKPVPASVMQFLDLDDSRPKAFTALVNQAHADADMTHSLCSPASTPDGQLICSLFESLSPFNEKAK